MSIGVSQRYALYDENNNEWIINNPALQILEDSFSTEVDTIERSYTEGAIAPGETRGTMKSLVLEIAQNSSSEQAYRLLINELFYRVRTAVRIRDRINNIETDVRPSEKAISYDPGGFLNGSSISVEFNQLIPFWKDIEFQEASETSSLSNQLIIDNDGFFKTPPVIILETRVEIPKLLVKVEETGEGIGINDLNFGRVDNDTYVIDCENGEILLGTSSRGGVLRNDRIISGTGFFNLRRGINTINVYTWQDRDLDTTVRYKRRYWV
jgi:hypothetical protein